MVEVAFRHSEDIILHSFWTDNSNTIVLNSHATLGGTVFFENYLSVVTFVL